MKRLATAAILLLALVQATLAQMTSAPTTGFVVPEGVEFSRLRAAGGSGVKLLADWSVIEPERGQFSWKSLDGVIAAAARAQLRIVVVLAYTPKWASPAEGHDLTDPAIYRHQPTNRRADWERFVSQVVSRYNGRVKDWQVWTTLSLPLYRGTSNEYVSLLQATHGKVKALDATSRLVLATAYGIDLVSVRHALLAAPGAFDVISLTPRGIAPEGLLRPLGVLRERLLANQRKTIWIEWDLLTGGLRPKWPGQVLKVMAVARAMGLEQVFWVSDAAVETRVFPVWSARLGSKPFVGYFVSQQALVLLFGETDTAGVAWSTTGEVSISLDAQEATVYTPTGAARHLASEGGKITVRVSPDPVIVTGIGPASVAQAKSTVQSKGPPVAPRSVDYNHATEVSARLGATNVEEGLYNMRYRTRRNGALEVVHVDGTEAVRTNASKEIVFVYFHVDDSFLYYVDGRAKVEIAVEVWGAKSPQRLGFNILYDSMTGYRFTPWQWVDVKDGWVTYTVRLSDANFSGTWGWDFAINAAGNRTEDLTVRSVTVRKISASSP